jgi:hypothetical protein
MNEEWKQIPSYPNYLASNLGNIKHKKGNIKKQTIRQKYLSVKIAGIGYRFVHRLIAETFIPNLENKPYVNHIDGNKLNNCAINLEWVTQNENMLHSHKVILRKKNRYLHYYPQANTMWYEIWKDALGYENMIEVSNFGRVKRKPHTIQYKYKIKNIAAYIMPQHLSDSGYYYVHLTINGKRKNIRIHKLVAETFIPNIDHKPFVNHIDSNKENNMAENLEWVTESENATHSYLYRLNV